MKKEVTTALIQAQKEYTLPDVIYEKLNLEVLKYNKKKNEWRKVDYQLVLLPKGKELKTDTGLKVYFD